MEKVDYVIGLYLMEPFFRLFFLVTFIPCRTTLQSHRIITVFRNWLDVKWDLNETVDVDLLNLVELMFEDQLAHYCGQ